MLPTSFLLVSLCRSFVRSPAGGEVGVVCENFDEATILFTKICDFQPICNKIGPVDIVNLLNLVYSAFDEIIERHGVYKVETIGQ